MLDAPTKDQTAPSQWLSLAAKRRKQLALRWGGGHMTGDRTLADVTRKPGANTRFPAKTTPLL
ncbi:hypothetical protein D7S65_17060 [Ralstonia insidiosa]|jgi:hypothetical protein|nr:hypothetical protein [Ralstonia insidiosa]MBA9872227.1 hypothetical protein [Ralstonia insidiosa]MBA9914087.1 hypothetical protein [Ralstonia insidiosa]MBA9938497.1 hypothetical protein [Ralstonia insidiosa]